MKLYINGNELELDKFVDIKANIGKTVLTHRPCNPDIELEFVKEAEGEFVKIFPHFSLINKGVSLLGGAVVLREDCTIKLMAVNCSHKPVRLAEDDLLFTIETSEEQQLEEEEDEPLSKPKHRNKIVPPPILK